MKQGLVFVDKETLFREADYLTIHTPLQEDTRHLVNATTLALMFSDPNSTAGLRNGIETAKTWLSALEAVQSASVHVTTEGSRAVAEFELVRASPEEALAK